MWRRGLRTQAGGAMIRTVSLLFAVACEGAGEPPPVAAPQPIASIQAPSATEVEEHARRVGSVDHSHAQDGVGDHATVSHRFADAQRWAQVFDDPARDGWQRPEELVEALRIPPGSRVADIGAGTGYFNPHLARAVGASGKVLAIDVEPSLVAHMQQRADQEHTPVVEARLGTAHDPGIRPEDAVDLVLLVDTYHHIDQRRAYFSTLRDVLSPGARLVIVDFKPGELPVGPGPDHKIAEEQVVAELVAAGWTAAGSVDLLPYQYVRLFERPEA